ncbi:hypothetical protein JOC86_001057 [Bacillus pakistanensis]|uniref:beta-galactosidase n=1 Tax=Rossellomorea pakistanensis TaxID=992288 RepID=A0ABS2N9Q0_9BACI|nr:beta-galactosidase small subunit [Bacillus pakistanensis]MBM7584520.1 hypothetical protein [Bacillus pakistanensis]
MVSRIYKCSISFPGNSTLCSNGKSNRLIQEAYVDSKLANRFGVYSSRVEELYTPYAYPQENGNRHDVRWVSLTNARGVGFIIVGVPRIDFSAHYYTTENIDKAQHPYELVKQDFITLNLDHKQHGLGSASCGPDVLSPYQLKNTLSNSKFT